jgi:hypothetical protein
MIMPEILQQRLKYDPETGVLRWRERTPDSFQQKRQSPQHQCRSWNAKYANKEAFTAVCKSGHKRGRIDGVNYLAHRVIWAIVYGEWPKIIIDHCNMNPADNRLCNLRLATKRQNGCNRRAQGRSKYLGVGWHKKAGKWKAAISVHNKTLHLGLHETEESAAIAYNKAASVYHGVFARLNQINS